MIRAGRHVLLRTFIRLRSGITQGIILSSPRYTVVSLRTARPASTPALRTWHGNTVRVCPL